MSLSFSELSEAVLLILDIDAAEDTLAKEQVSYQSRVCANLVTYLGS
jgi:hypothetical protein